jgi:hypothetical protein
METIAQSPLTATAREAWAAVLRQVLAYRDRYQITDPAEPLGTETQCERGEAYTVAARALQTITSAERVRSTPRTLPNRRRLERVPAVLTEARSGAEPNTCGVRLRRDHGEIRPIGDAIVSPVAVGSPDISASGNMVSTRLLLPRTCAAGICRIKDLPVPVDHLAELRTGLDHEAPHAPDANGLTSC